MEITEVRVKLMEESGERLQAFCSITFDDAFVVRDLKIIEGATGPFVAMPSRKLTTHCPQCGYKNHLRAGYCNQCGARLREQSAGSDEEGRAKLYADIAHPINSACREMIQQRVIAAYEEERRRSKLPGYVPSYDDQDFDAGPAETPLPRAAAREEPEVVGEPSAPMHPTAFEGAEKPRGPHIAPAKTPPSGPRTPHSHLSRGPAQTEAPKTNQFGAGIFE